MASKKINILLSEKIISIFSLFTVGILGIIWIVFSFFSKKQISQFLKYNIIQSIIFGIFLYVINISNNLFIKLATTNSMFTFISDFINNLFIIKKIRIYDLGLSFTYFELVLFIILFYFAIGIIIGKRFYFPIISNLAKTFSK